jgi:cytidine diphosphoramidate kinase
MGVRVIVWITGLSGSGKTTLGTALRDEVVADGGRATVLLDGDEMRRILGRDSTGSDYSVSSRRFVTERYHEICRWLDSQGIDVICCVIGMFPEILERNRTAFSDYFEVFLDAPLELLVERDPKDLYRKALAGELADVVGVDIDYPSPPAPDLRIAVEAEMPSAIDLARHVATAIGARAALSRP